MQTQAMTPGGYVIEVVGSTWLWEYRARAQRPNHYRGEPTNFEPAKLGHARASMELRAKLAVWAFTMVPTALSKHKDAQEIETAMLRVDATGRMLAAMLRGEIGPGAVILYVDVFRDACGGAHMWQVCDDGVLLPYFHRPSAGYVIDHEDAGGWAREFRPADRLLVGEVAACGDKWCGELPIERELVRAFGRWHGEWSEAVQAGDEGRSFDWDAHNAEGLALATRLKSSLGEYYTIIYLRPSESPGQNHPRRAFQVRSDGTTRPYVHRPYWAESEYLNGES